MNALKASGWAVQALVAIMLGACASGGGGGGGSSPIASPPPPPPIVPTPPPTALPPLPPLAAPGSYPSATSAEYTNDWGPEGINADAAWQYQNAHGEGIVIGVIDDGIIINHPELQGRISPDSVDINTSRNALVSPDNTHGAELSSLIAGNFNGSQTVGVAYEATILAVRADNGADSFNTDDLAHAVDYAVAHGVKVINFSLGSSAPSGDAFKAAISRATAAGVIIVTSAGNDGPFLTNPNYPGFLATDPSVAHGLILIAGANSSDGTFNTRSNPAGVASQYYLTAPGWQIVVPDYGPVGPLAGYQQCWPNPSVCNGLVEIQGTSYSAPHVTGAIAVLMSAFPGLTPQQVVQIILQSTDDQGAAGIDSQTGWGKLNLGRAFQPIGTVAAPLLVGSPEITGSTPLGAVGAAFGDGFSNDDGEWRIAGFDSYGRTYALDLGANWRRAAAGPALAAQAPALWRSAHGGGGAVMQFAPADDVAPQSYRMQIAREDVERPSVRIDAPLGAGFTLAFASDGAETRHFETDAAIGHLAYVNADKSVRLSHDLGAHVAVSLSTENGADEAGLDRTPIERSAQTFDATFSFDGAALTTTLGRIGESQGVLGLLWSDEFGSTPGGEIRFAGLSGHFDPTPRWRVGFDAELGAAELARGGWIMGDAPLRTTSFSLEARYDALPAWVTHGDGGFTLSVEQPLRVEHGAIDVALPQATNFGRKSLSYENRNIDVTPSGRELRFGLGYRYARSGVVSAYGEALLITEPGHVAAAEDETMVRFGVRVRQ